MKKLSLSQHSIVPLNQYSSLHVLPIGPKSNIQAFRSLIDSPQRNRKEFCLRFGLYGVIELFVA